MGFDTNKWFKQKYLSEAGVILESELVKALNQAIPDNTGYKEFAQAVAAILKDEYGSQNFGPFMEVLHAELGMKPLNEAEESEIESLDLVYTEREGLFNRARAAYKDGSTKDFFGAKFDDLLKDLGINKTFAEDDITDRDIIKSLRDKNIKVSFSEKDVS
jgi:hypothetical protein